MATESALLLELTNRKRAVSPSGDEKNNRGFFGVALLVVDQQPLRSYPKPFLGRRGPPWARANFVFLLQFGFELLDFSLLAVLGRLALKAVGKAAMAVLEERPEPVIELVGVKVEFTTDGTRRLYQWDGDLHVIGNDDAFCS